MKEVRLWIEAFEGIYTFSTILIIVTRTDNTTQYREIHGCSLNFFSWSIYFVEW